jgi:CheY-like chemotaxis protein
MHAQEGIHAVIVDLHMPGMDGLETARAIRNSREPWSGVPILAMTARSDEPAVSAATAAGMNGFLVKPVEAALLYDTVARLISGGAALSPRNCAGAPLPPTATWRSSPTPASRRTSRAR